MTVVSINKKSYTIPASWYELKPYQLTTVAPLLLGSFETLALRQSAVLFYFLPGIKKFWLRHPWVNWLIKKVPAAQKKYPVLTDAQKWDMLLCTKFLFDDIQGASILQFFTHNNTTYFLPGDNFTRESIIAFAFADEYFNKYVETTEEKYIDLLIACIARQKGSKTYPALQFVEGDIREHFSTSRTAERAKAFKTLPVKIRSTILLYFLGSKKFIHKQYEILFRKKQEEKKEGIEKNDVRERMKSFGKKKIPSPNFNWLGVIYELSEQGTFGNFDQVKHMFVHTCCYYLAKKRYDQEQQTA